MSINNSFSFNSLETLANLKKVLIDCFKHGYPFLLTLVSILLVILFPFASSFYDGDNFGHVHCLITFKVSLWGSWWEERDLPAYPPVDFYFGTASDRGQQSYALVALIFIILALLLCLFGGTGLIAPLHSPSSFPSETKFRKVKAFKFSSYLCSFLGGLFGLLSLLFFLFFTTTVIQPYSYALPIPPPLRFTFSYYYSLLVFCFYFIFGLYRLIQYFRKSI